MLKNTKYYFNTCANQAEIVVSQIKISPLPLQAKSPAKRFARRFFILLKRVLNPLNDAKSS
ncbi:MAG: hypothetical protein CTY27_03860, partial [Methylotenera sp.]